MVHPSPTIFDCLATINRGLARYSFHRHLFNKHLTSLVPCPLSFLGGLPNLSISCHNPYWAWIRYLFAKLFIFYRKGTYNSKSNLFNFYIYYQFYPWQPNSLLDKLIVLPIFFFLEVIICHDNIAWELCFLFFKPGNECPLFISISLFLATHLLPKEWWRFKTWKKVENVSFFEK